MDTGYEDFYGTYQGHLTIILPLLIRAMLPVLPCYMLFFMLLHSSGVLLLCSLFITSTNQQTYACILNNDWGRIK